MIKSLQLRVFCYRDGNDVVEMDWFFGHLYSE